MSGRTERRPICSWPSEGTCVGRGMLGSCENDTVNTPINYRSGLIAGRLRSYFGPAKWGGQLKRYDYIDALRGYAVLGVLLVHCSQYVGFDRFAAFGAR